MTFKCSKCGQEFKSQQELDAHMRMHSNPEVAGVA
ncbi:MAG: C2H2-type zinc finger protein [Nitrososphaerales archaeon]